MLIRNDDRFTELLPAVCRAFACTFIHMINGTPPMAGSNAMQIMTKVRRVHSGTGLGSPQLPFNAIQTSLSKVALVLPRGLPASTVSSSSLFQP